MLLSSIKSFPFKIDREEQYKNVSIDEFLNMFLELAGDSMFNPNGANSFMITVDKICPNHKYNTTLSIKVKPQIYVRFKKELAYEIEVVVKNTNGTVIHNYYDPYLIKIDSKIKTFYDLLKEILYKMNNTKVVAAETSRLNAKSYLSGYVYLTKDYINRFMELRYIYKKDNKDLYNFVQENIYVSTNLFA